MVDRELAIIFLVSIAIVGAVTVLMHERHYQSRKEMILEGRIATLEKIVGESRGS
jgi:hypothetical protein